MHHNRDLAHLKDIVWELAKTIPGEDPNQWRQDPYDNFICYGRYGEEHRYGWVIDHIQPVAKNGSDHIDNLQAMQIDKNRELGDSTDGKKSRHNQ